LVIANHVTVEKVERRFLQNWPDFGSSGRAAEIFADVWVQE
jgi:hypothetical protein